MSRPEQHARPPRRAVLAVALTGSVLGLTGCGIRLEKDAPKIPGIKTQAPPADQAVLRKVLTDVAAAIMCAHYDDASWAPRLGTMHKKQRTRLTKVMATQGMTPAPRRRTGTGSGIVSDTEPMPLATFEQQTAMDIGSLAGLTARNLPMAAAIGVTHGAAAQLLGRPAEPSGGTVPSPAAVPTAILPALQAAIYAFEVIVAKTPLDSRKRAEATLTALRPTRAAWEAALGADAPAQPDGYTLPVQPTSDARRTKLAHLVLGDLVDACAGQVAPTRGDRGSFIGLTDLWVTATAQLWRWDTTPRPFPGLQ